MRGKQNKNTPREREKSVERPLVFERHAKRVKARGDFSLVESVTHATCIFFIGQKEKSEVIILAQPNFATSAEVVT